MVPCIVLKLHRHVLGRCLLRIHELILRFPSHVGRCTIILNIHDSVVVQDLDAILTQVLRLVVWVLLALGFIVFELGLILSAILYWA